NKAPNARRLFGEEEGGTLALRSRLVCRIAGRDSRLRRQLPHRSGDILTIDLAILHGDASTDDQLTRTLRLRVKPESHLFRLAANLPGNDHLIRFDRSD